MFNWLVIPSLATWRLSAFPIRIILDNGSHGVVGYCHAPHVPVFFAIIMSNVKKRESSRKN